MSLTAAVPSETVAEELVCVQAIFPKLEIESDLQSCAIRLLVILEWAFALKLKSEEYGSGASVRRSASLNHLPAIRCKISIPPGIHRNRPRFSY